MLGKTLQLLNSVEPLTLMPLTQPCNRKHSSTSHAWVEKEGVGESGVENEGQGL